MGQPGRADRTVTVYRIIGAPADHIFELLSHPARHSEFDGSGMLRGAVRGPERLSSGASFSLAMSQSGVSYRSLNTVVDFREGELLRWQTAGRWHGRRVMGGQLWGYRLIAVQSPEPATLVIHTYDWGAALAAPALRLGGYPRRMAAAMPASLARLALAVDG